MPSDTSNNEYIPDTVDTVDTMPYLDRNIKLLGDNMVIDKMTVYLQTLNGFYKSDLFST